MLDENPEDIISLSLGNKLYEMSNHLGNVLTVINVIKVPQSANTIDIDGYLATIVSTADYSPFGVQLDGRTVSAETYRYGFNGMEKDDELKGSGNSYDFGARMHDPRLGRWMIRDSKCQKKPYYSPYQAMKNNPLMYNDPDGKDEYLRIIINVEGSSQPIVIESATPVRTGIYLAGDIMYGGERRMFPTQIMYDFTTTLTINVDKNGNPVSMPISSTEPEQKKDGKVYHETLYLGWFGSGTKKGGIIDKNSNFTQQGGYYMTSENGLGTIWKSKNQPKYIGNIDDIMTAINALGKLDRINKVMKKQQSGMFALEQLAAETFLEAFLGDAVKAVQDQMQNKPNSSGSKTGQVGDEAFISFEGKEYKFLQTDKDGNGK